MKKSTLARLAAGAALTTGLGVGLAVPAMADGGGASNEGNCSMNSNWELKASTNGDGFRHDDHGRHRGIKVEFRVRTDGGGHHPGDLWNWMVSDNGTVVRQGSGHARQGDDSLRREIVIKNLDGADMIQFDAMNTVTGETCQGQVVLHSGRRH